MAVTASTERQVEALVASCAAPADSTELFESVSRRLRRMVPYDGAAWFATDPVTTLATCPVRIENVEAGHCSSPSSSATTARSNTRRPTPTA